MGVITDLGRVDVGECGSVRVVFAVLLQVAARESTVPSISKHGVSGMSVRAGRHE